MAHWLVPLFMDTVDVLLATLRILWGILVVQVSVCIVDIMVSLNGSSILSTKIMFQWLGKKSWSTWAITSKYIIENGQKIMFFIGSDGICVSIKDLVNQSNVK